MSELQFLDKLLAMFLIFRLMFNTMRRARMEEMFLFIQKTFSSQDKSVSCIITQSQWRWWRRKVETVLLMYLLFILNYCHDSYGKME